VVGQGLRVDAGSEFILGVIRQMLILFAAYNDRGVEGRASGRGKGETLPLNVLLPRCCWFF
jgi:hypothetical protein